MERLFSLELKMLVNHRDEMQAQIELAKAGLTHAQAGEPSRGQRRSDGRSGAGSSLGTQRLKSKRL